jgi:hypothetical protein
MTFQASESVLLKLHIAGKKVIPRLAQKNRFFSFEWERCE